MMFAHLNKRGLGEIRIGRFLVGVHEEEGNLALARRYSPLVTPPEIRKTVFLRVIDPDLRRTRGYEQVVFFPLEEIKVLEAVLRRIKGELDPEPLKTELEDWQIPKPFVVPVYTIYATRKDRNRAEIGEAIEGAKHTGGRA